MHFLNPQYAGERAILLSEELIQSYKRNCTTLFSISRYRKEWKKKPLYWFTKNTKWNILHWLQPTFNLLDTCKFLTFSFMRLLVNSRILFLSCLYLYFFIPCKPQTQLWLHGFAVLFKCLHEIFKKQISQSYMSWRNALQLPIPLYKFFSC